MLPRCHAEAQHRIGRPILLQLLDGKTLEQLPPPLEIGLQRGDKQRLAEPSRTAQEDVLAQVDHVPDIGRLVHIEHTILDDVRECLYAYRQSLQMLLFHIFTCYTHFLFSNPPAYASRNRS